MSLILPENVLEQVKCSLCKSYLSCGPTKIIEGNRIACGRCVSKDTGVPSLFNKIAPFALFPCVNRYEGCNKLLQYNDVEKHEKECIGGKYPCPICPPDKYPLQSLQKLIHHYNQKHANFVLKTPEISIKLEDMITDRYYLYCDNVNNYLFVIYVELNEEMLKCNASVAGNRWKDVIQIIDKTYYRRVCSAYNDNSTIFQITMDKLPNFNELVMLKFLFQMDNVPALILDNFTPPDCGESKHLYQNWPKILFGKRLINQWELVSKKDRDFKLSNDSFKLINLKDRSISIPIKCSFCENYFWNCKWNSKSNLYSHSKECIICVQCYENKYISCYIHHQRFDQYSDIQLPIFNMFFSCRNNCGLTFPVWQLKEHEDACFEGENEPNVKLLFKNEISTNNIVYHKSSYFVRGNVIEVIKTAPIGGNIFMVTYDGFKIILNYRFDGYKLILEDAHTYDRSKYYILFRIHEYDPRRLSTSVREEMHKVVILDYRNPYLFVVFINSVPNSLVHINKNK